MCVFKNSTRAQIVQFNPFKTGGLILKESILERYILRYNSFWTLTSTEIA